MSTSGRSNTASKGYHPPTAAPCWSRNTRRENSLVGNLISLADDQAFLRRFDVTEPAKAIVLIDNKMSERTVQQ
jgi:hypothetical protein